jgi:uncharacterized membrane protein
MTRSQKALAAFFTCTMHFARRRDYEAIMPPYVPSHREAVAVSGFAEIAGGLAVIPRGTRGLALWARLPLQPLIMWWVWRATAARSAP